MKSVTVTVPAYREEPELLRKAIDSLLKQSYGNYRVFIVLDSAASVPVKSTAKELSKNKKIRVIQDRNRGSASHRNLSVKTAWKKSDYFAFTDGDCIADKDWLKRLVESIEKLPADVGCVGGVNLSEETTTIGKAIECAEASFMGGGGVSGQTTIRKKIRYVNSIPNCNAIYRKACWKNNRQDVKFIKGQDGEFNLRLAKQGWKFVQIPNAIIYHKKQDTFGEYSKRIYNYGKASAKVIKKHGIYGLKRFWYSAGTFGFYLVLSVLLCLSIFSISFLKAFAVLLILYLLLVLAAVIIASAKISKKACPLSTFIILGQHLSYAAGFLVGFLK